jgi:hypothetical protein
VQRSSQLWFTNPSKPLMTKTQADQIAALLNDRNQLVVAYDADRVLAHVDNYLFALMTRAPSSRLLS